MGTNNNGTVLVLAGIACQPTPTSAKMAMMRMFYSSGQIFDPTFDPTIIDPTIDPANLTQLIDAYPLRSTIYHMELSSEGVI